MSPRNAKGGVRKIFSELATLSSTFKTATPPLRLLSKMTETDFITADEIVP
jgi:hypothetical protein